MISNNETFNHGRGNDPSARVNLVFNVAASPADLGAGGSGNVPTGVDAVRSFALAFALVRIPLSAAKHVTWRCLHWGLLIVNQVCPFSNLTRPFGGVFAQRVDERDLWCLVTPRA